MSHHPCSSIRVTLCLLGTISASSVSPSPAQDAHPHPHYESHKHATTTDASRFVTSRSSQVDLPLPEEKDAFVFAVFGDRTGGPHEGIQVLTQAVTDVNLFEPDLVMTVGDLVEGYTDNAGWIPQMKEFKQEMGKLLCPWFPVAGNHDVYWRGENKPAGEHEQNYEMHFGPLWYAFSHKNCWFIVLYSDEGDPATGTKTYQVPAAQKVSPEQFAWLRKTLGTSSAAEHVFVFLHHPRWLGGGYGDDWERIHQLLVEAGNVRIVFAGHIHRMRYDGPRDGIEYVTLATVGGGQSGIAPQAGYLHQYHLVTVRKQQIALACLPVGEAMNVREITGELSEEIRTLAQSPPQFLQRAAVGQDGEAAQPMIVELFNPTSRPVEVTLHVDASDGNWVAAPDHVHRKVHPGERMTASMALAVRGDLDFDRYTSPTLVVESEYLAHTARVRVNEVRLEIPVDWNVSPPPPPATDLAVRLDGDAYLAVDSSILEIPDGPVTLECWFNARTFAGRVGLVAKTASSEFGLFAGGAVPEFSIFLDGRYVEVRSDTPVLKTSTWNHLAGVFDGQEVRLYLNGRLVDRAAGSGKRGTNGLPLLVGADVDSVGRGVSQFDGMLDGVRLSTVARYRGEQFTPLRQVESDAETSLLLNFDGLIGPLAFDESPHAAHAICHGSVVLVPSE